MTLRSMKRREFIALLGGASIMRPLAARGQQGAVVKRLGYVTNGTEDDLEVKNRQAAFLASLEKAGWVDGRNIHIDYRWGNVSTERARVAAAQIVGLQPDVILAQGSTTAEALLQTTRSIPVVFVGASDPLSSGLHPGGNLTGFTNYEFTIGGKWLEILNEVAPGVERVLVLQDRNIGNQGLYNAIRTAARSLGVEPIQGVATNAAEIERAVTTFAQKPNGGPIVLPGAPRMESRDLIVALAASARLPAMYTARQFVASGGLMSFDTDIFELYRRAASYVDRILRGEKAGDLPVQVPTKYELVINLKVAKALGLDVPPMLLARADEVIE